jgi:predicted acylesterase/phospholipase RssA
MNLGHAFAGKGSRGEAFETASTGVRMPIGPFKKKPSGPKPISLALQGGGSHGAFEWGVLDRLLEKKTSRSRR